MNFKVFRTEMFEEEFKKLPKVEQERIGKFEGHLSENPFAGKPLGFMFLREKRLNGRRVYYLIYKDLIAVLMVAISDKKGQQTKINAIKTRLGYYQLVKAILNGSNKPFLFFQL